MAIQQVLHYKGLEHDKSVIERLVAENLNGKLDSYLHRFEIQPEDKIEMWFEAHDSRFNGKLVVHIGNRDWRYSRESYKKLDDLINHLFDHLKDDLSEMPKIRERKMAEISRHHGSVDEVSYRS